MTTRFSSAARTVATTLVMSAAYFAWQLARAPLPAIALQAPNDESRQRLAARALAQVEAFTGPVANPCGILWVADRAPIEVTQPARQDIEVAARCVMDARARGLATWVLWQSRGLHSVLTGLATTATSDVHAVGGSSGLRPCLGARVVHEGEYSRIRCDNRIESLSGSALTDAIVRLESDVTATAGQVRAEAIGPIVRNAEADASPSHPGFLTRIVDDVQLQIQNETNADWPLCPRHGNHSLEFRDHRWFCPRDGAFLAELGGLAAIRARPRP